MCRRCLTTAGSSATSPTCLCTFSAPRITPVNRRGGSDGQGGAEDEGDEDERLEVPGRARARAAKGLRGPREVALPRDEGGAEDVGDEHRRLRRSSLQIRERPRARLVRGGVLAAQEGPDSVPDG